MSDQSTSAPEPVVSGPVWNMTPTVEYIIKQVEAGAYTAQDLKDFSMVAKGGASLAPIKQRGHRWHPAGTHRPGHHKEEAIKAGTFHRYQ